MRNLLAVLFGWGVGKKIQKHLEEKEGKKGFSDVTERQAKKIIDNDPELKKQLEKQKKDAEKMDVRIKKTYSKLSPESKAHFKKLFPDFKE